jgi:hypothetical protein
MLGVGSKENNFENRKPFATRKFLQKRKKQSRESGNSIVLVHAKMGHLTNDFPIFACAQKGICGWFYCNVDCRVMMDLDRSLRGIGEDWNDGFGQRAIEVGIARD